MVLCKAMGQDVSTRRVKVVYSGRVQGVGFRFTTRSLARRYGVVGYVRNCPDGTVELVAEAAPEVLKSFLEAVERNFKGYIREAVLTELSGGEPFNSFDIRF